MSPSFARRGRRFGGRLAPETGVRIESRSLESIHIHDVVCLLDTRLGAILERMAADTDAGEGEAR